MNTCKSYGCNRYVPDGMEYCPQCQLDVYGKVEYSEWLISCDGYYPYCRACCYEPSYEETEKARTFGMLKKIIPICPKCGAKML